MSILGPKKLIRLNPDQIGSISSRPIPAEVIENAPTHNKIGFLSKAGIFFRWSSYTLTLLLAASIIYTIHYGWPRVLRHVELSFIEDRVDEMAKTFARTEDKLSDITDKVDLQQIVIDKKIKGKKE